MNSKVKKGIVLFALMIAVAMIWNIGFTVYNKILTPTVVSDLSLGQMSGEDAIAITAGRLAADGTIWNTVQWVGDGIIFLLLIFATINLIKGLKEYADSIPIKEEK